MHEDKFAPYFLIFIFHIIDSREGSMFSFLFKEPFIRTMTDTIVEKITKEVNSSLERTSGKQNRKLDTVIEHLEQLKFELSSLDQRLTQKELRDKTEYGQMQYRIRSLQNDLREKPLKKVN